MKNYSLFTALITPMQRDGSVHFEDLIHLAERQNEVGAGILLAGSTGEGLALTDDEKREVIDVVTGLNLSVPIMAGVGGLDLPKQKEWIAFCNEHNVDAFLLVTPLYAKPGVKGQVAWFRNLLDTADKPCMLYNIPSRTGTKMAPEVLEALAGHKRLWALKEASGSIAEFKTFRKTAPDLPLFSGDDALMPDFAIEGGKGLVSVASNIWPDETLLYLQKCLSGDTDSLFPVWPNAIRALFSASNPIPAKWLLKEKGLITELVVRLPLSEEDLGKTEQLIEADQQIKQWYKTNKD
ncbi:MAG: 4-hydroxy-tetrahydrodipicolinate synthase [Balneolaceae bacterium]|nr:MAG: 4-hydroxy-tetrahydrodipicolinate synthase [Balneolaceae bacterium]